MAPETVLCCSFLSLRLKVQVVDSDVHLSSPCRNGTALPHQPLAGWSLRIPVSSRVRRVSSAARVYACASWDRHDPLSSSLQVMSSELHLGTGKTPVETQTLRLRSLPSPPFLCPSLSFFCQVCIPNSLLNLLHANVPSWESLF